MSNAIPRGIKQDLALISKVWAELDDFAQPSAELVKQQVGKLYFDRHRQNCSFVCCKVEYFDGGEKLDTT